MRIIPTAACLAVAALALGACGNRDDTAATDATPATDVAAPYPAATGTGADTTGTGMMGPGDTGAATGTTGTTDGVSSPTGAPADAPAGQTTPP